jgi:hypothetical protein
MHTATAVREGKWWMVTVDGVDGVTQARRLSEVNRMAQEFVAATLDIPTESFGVLVSVKNVGDVEVESDLAAIRAERAHAAQLDRHATGRAVGLAKRLAAADVPLRDIGTIIGVSFQRAHQLVNTADDWSAVSVNDFVDERGDSEGDRAAGRIPAGDDATRLGRAGRQNQR